MSKIDDGGPAFPVCPLPMIPPGTRVVAYDLRMANPRSSKFAHRTYTTVTIRGEVMRRDSRILMGWNLAGPVWSEGPPLPTRLATGHYWVQPDSVGNRSKPGAILVHEDEMEVTR